MSPLRLLCFPTLAAWSLALSGCYLQHGVSERDAAVGTDASYAPERDAEVPRDGGPASCALADDTLRFDVEALAPGVASEPRGIDGTGRVYLEVDGRAMWWTRARGLEPLAGLPPGEVVRIAAVEWDGSIAGALAGPEHLQAFVWRDPGGLVDLSVDDGSDSIARGITAEGMVLIDEGPRASLRTMTRHTVPLGLPRGAHPRHAEVDALDVAANGTVVGTATLDATTGVWRAFAWTSATGIELLPDDGGRVARALAVSDDGAIVVGTASAPGRTEMTPARWRAGALERISLLDDPELVWGAAIDVTVDGVIVGTDSGPSATGPTAYAWMLDGDRKVALDSLLDDAGWHVTRAIRVTDDLRVLAIAERDGSGVREAVLLTPRCDVAR